MGLENREYMQDEFSDGAGFGSRPRPRLSAVAQIIVITIAVFLLQLLTVSEQSDFAGLLRDSSVESWLRMDVESVLSRGQVWRLATYALCHNRANIWHIAMNLMMLYFAGQMVLSVMSEREFRWFYAASAVFAGIVSLVFCRFFLPQAQILGASGAVLSVLTVAALHYPRREVLLMGILPLQMRWLLLLYVAMDLLPLLSGSWRQSQTAHTAHLGGVLFGFLYVRQNMNFSRWLEEFPRRVGDRGRIAI
jgi:membrane associated rhomboid family serine protease